MLKMIIKNPINIIFFIIFSIYPSIITAATTPSKSKFQVGVLYWSMNIPGQVAMRKGLEQEANKINQHATNTNLPHVKLISRVAGDGNEGIARQIKQMYELIQIKPDILIVQPTDNAALSAPLKVANQLGIPVIAYDQYISGGQLASYITSDNYQAGYLNGEYVAANFPKNQTLNIILVDYPHVSSTVERVDGFLSGLQENQQPYRIIKTYEAVEPIGGQRAGNDIIHDFPQLGSIDVIFTVNDGGGLSVVDRLAKAGRKEIFVATVDGDPASVVNIRNKRLTQIDSAQFCGPMGAEAIKTAYKMLLGESIAKHILIPVFPITQKTIAYYPGWLGPIPKSFKKPWQAINPYWHGNLKIK